MPSKRKSKRLKPNPAGYSSRPLKDKLGIKEGAAIAILEAPANYASLVGIERFDTELDLDSYDFLHFFTASAIGLGHVFPVLAKRLKMDGMLWISWPKLSSKVETDLSENVVRAIGLANGLVDVKVAAVDDVWSGLKFIYRLSDRA
ncbi:MAG: DUF3052 domain-containing protein [Bacteroidota bacterium]|nr:DUF3052 domain-containing protein [Bacteroidota bacterium]MDP4231741.1 DUF3052 domain-containing protein [Bacteroidota bacterium]MDP4243477.1 DUF3052 domain-containing protein [Bacteroidota bacterium]MDP4289358.1 DUF3052 domain-containing protein [Bacteroidota bacterium]